MKKIFNSRSLVCFVFITFLVSAVFIAIKIILAPAGPMQDVGVKSDYALMLLQCVLGMVVMLLPEIFKRKLNITIPSGMVIAFAIFLYCAVFLGEVNNFYFRIPHWDTMLHTFSGFALGAFGLSLMSILNKSESVPVSLSPAFIAIFAFCFAVAIGVVWEIYEFTVDTVSDLNMQKYLLENGEGLIGRAALADTMKDLIVDSLGALVISIAGYISMKHKTGWLERMQIKLNRPERIPVPVYTQQMPAPQSQPTMAIVENISNHEDLRIAV